MGLGEAALCLNIAPPLAINGGKHGALQGEISSAVLGQCLGNSSTVLFASAGSSPLGEWFFFFSLFMAVIFSGDRSACCTCFPMGAKFRVKSHLYISLPVGETKGFLSLCLSLTRLYAHFRITSLPFPSSLPNPRSTTALSLVQDVSSQHPAPATIAATAPHCHCLYPP